MADLRRRGVVFFVEGARLRYRAPAGAYTDADRAAVRAQLPELLKLLPDSEPTEGDGTAAHRRLHAGLDAAARAQIEGEGASKDALAHLVMRAVVCAPEPCAWRLYSHRLKRELWICCNLAALRGLERDGLPVVLADDLERLRPLDDATLVGVLDVLATFPGAHVADVTLDTSETVA